MGKVEKIVVLSVLFLIVVILGVSQSGWGVGQSEASEPDGADVAGLDPLDRRDEQLSRPLDVEPRPDDPVDASSADVAGAPRGSEPAGTAGDVGTNGLLSTVVRDPQRVDPTPERSPGRRDPEPPVVPALDPAWDLVTLTGLQDTYDPGYKVYTVGRAETFESIALALYGDEELARLLRHANEDVAGLTRGQRLLVPVEDDGLAGATTYTVLDGENLWVVAKKFYGAGHRWNEIYEANRDVLKSPDAVRAGDVLRIP